MSNRDLGGFEGNMFDVGIVYCNNCNLMIEAIFFKVGYFYGWIWSNDYESESEPSHM